MKQEGINLGMMPLLAYCLKPLNRKTPAKTLIYSLGTSQHSPNTIKVQKAKLELVIT